MLVGAAMPVESRLLGLAGRSRRSSRAGVVPAPPLLLALVRLRELRTVTVEGMWDWFSAEPGRGEARGGLEVGAGSLDRAECTRCSSFCILPIRPRIWVREVELGNVDGSARLSVALRETGVTRPPLAVEEGLRLCCGIRAE